MTNPILPDSKEPAILLSIAENISKFLVIWFGQLVSLLGLGLTSFALEIWIYQRTGSITYLLRCALEKSALYSGKPPRDGITLLNALAERLKIRFLPRAHYFFRQSHRLLT